jgi:hypothetical protein
VKRGGGAVGLRGGSAFVALVVAACSGPASESVPGGRLEVEWTGADTGKLAGGAVAEWCAAPPMLEITAVQGDSGIGILLYPTDTVRADSYPLLRPERADSSRPAGAVALRWFGETAVKGFRSDSGSLIVTRSPDGRLAGRFSAELLSATDASRLHATGTFRGLTVVPPARGCPPRPAAQPPDTGVH